MVTISKNKDVYGVCNYCGDTSPNYGARMRKEKAPLRESLFESTAPVQERRGRLEQGDPRTIPFDAESQSVLQAGISANHMQLNVFAPTYTRSFNALLSHELGIVTSLVLSELYNQTRPELATEINGVQWCRISATTFCLDLLPGVGELALRNSLKLLVFLDFIGAMKVKNDTTKWYCVHEHIINTCMSDEFIFHLRGKITACKRNNIPPGIMSLGGG